MLVEDALNIYTDGSSFGAPRRGGIGMLFVQVDSQGAETLVESTFPGYRSATNNQMELQACITALQEARDRRLTDGFSKVVIHTDSMYVCDNINKAIFDWPKTRWHTRAGTPVLNVELWKQLVRLVKASSCHVQFRWVKGHSKNPLNRAADKAARASAQNPLHPALSQVSVRRKHTRERAERGSVRLIGQRLTIRVITCEWLHTQRVWKLKYEVVSKASPYHGKVDIAFSEVLLKDGHTYRVRMGENTENPRIAKMFREVV